MSEAKSLQEEIADLEAYLAGLPEDVAKSAYAEPYRARLAILRSKATRAEYVHAVEGLGRRKV